MKLELIVSRLHFDMGLFFHQVSDKKNYIEDLFLYLSENSIWHTDSKDESNKYTITNAKKLCDELIVCDFIKSHDIKHNILIDNSTKHIEQKTFQNIVEIVKVFFNKSDFIFFIEEKKSYGLDRNRIKSIISILMKKATIAKNNPADVEITFFGQEKIFTDEVLNLKRITSSTMKLFPSNPSKRIWDEIDKDLKETNVEKRFIKDKAPPKGSLNYNRGTKSFQMLNMIEDGYGEGKIRGISHSDEIVEIHSKDLVEKIRVDDKNENDLITKLLLKVSNIKDRFKTDDENDYH